MIDERVYLCTEMTTSYLLFLTSEITFRNPDIPFAYSCLSNMITFEMKGLPFNISDVLGMHMKSMEHSGFFSLRT